MPGRRLIAHFLICVNERPEGHPLPSCGRQGSGKVLEAFQQEIARRGFPAGVKATQTGCLTPCQYGPTICVYPEGIWYGGVSAEDVPAIIAAHVDRNDTVPGLLLPDEARLC